MAEAETDSPGTETTDGEGSQEDRIDRIEGKVDAQGNAITTMGQKIDQLLGLGHKPEQPERATRQSEEESMEALADRKVKELQAKEKAKEAAKKKADDDIDARVAAKVAEAIKEKPPREHRKVTEFMKWYDD